MAEIAILINVSKSIFMFMLVLRKFLIRIVCKGRFVYFQSRLSSQWIFSWFLGMSRVLGFMSVYTFKFKTMTVLHRNKNKK